MFYNYSNASKYKMLVILYILEIPIFKLFNNIDMTYLIGVLIEFVLGPVKNVGNNKSWFISLLIAHLVFT